MNRPRLNPGFLWECPACRRPYPHPQRAAACPCPANKLPAVAAPLVRSTELPMFDGHPLALTGWLEADQAELTVLHRQEVDGALSGHRLPLLCFAKEPGTHRRFRVGARLKRPRAFRAPPFCAYRWPGVS